MDTELFKRSYRALIENPYAIFMVMADGTILDKRLIYEFADLNEGTFSMCNLSVIPGSYNPLHDGHRFMYDEMPGFQKPNGSVKKAFEISVRRIGKPDLSEDELLERLKQFENYGNVIVTNAPRFIEKCAVMPRYVDVTWHVGVDTILRMRDDYGELGFDGLAGYFCVWDRDMGDGQGLKQYPLDFKILPNKVHRCHRDVPQHLWGMTSTKIRATLIK